MKLTKREIRLVSILLSLLFLISYFKFIIIPQHDKLSEIRALAVSFDEALYSGDTLEKEEDLNNRIVDINKEIEGISKEYFYNLKQEEIIFLLNDFMKLSGLEFSNVNFSKTLQEEYDEVVLNIMSMNLPYTGEYEELLVFLENIRNFDKKIVVKNMVINNNEDGTLSGNIVLNFYSISGLNLEDDTINWDSGTDYNKDNPFRPFEDYNFDFLDEDENTDELDYSDINLDNINIDFGDSQVVLESFEDLNFNFLASNNNGRGTLLKDTNSVRGEYSLRVDYNFEGGNDENIGYVKFKDNDVTKVPERLGLWIYSYDLSQDSINLNIIDRKNNEYPLKVTENINWMGWKEFKITPPNDRGLYPLKIDSIEIVINSPHGGSGAILVDDLKAYYKTIEDTPIINNSKKEDIKNNTVKTNNYEEYVVKKGDTLFSIAKGVYNNSSLIDEIIKINKILDITNIRVGEILKIPQK